VQAPLTTAVHWGETLYVRPLLELLDDYERYGVILVDKERARVFTVFLGEIEEEREALAAAEVRHKKASGTDHLRSQMNFQRQDEMHVRWHLKAVAEVTDELARSHTFDRLVLAGPVAATSELHRLLPKRLRARVVGTVRLPFDASPQDVLRETLGLEQAAERAEERQRVEVLLTAAAKGNGGVVGLEPTLEAIQERRVWRLVYAAGYDARGVECSQCGALLPSTPEKCVYCGAPPRLVDDLLERAIRRVVDGGGDVEQVHDEAATRLWEAGGIGALLRF
jgi:peptide chain release factor subunit 1